MVSVDGERLWQLALRPMANSKTNRVNPKILNAAVETINNLETTVSGYKPANDAYTLAKATAARDRYVSTNKEESRLKALFDAARDEAAAAENDFNDMAVNVREQVSAQFGRSSDEVASVGRKKKSERKAPTRKAKPAA